MLFASGGNTGATITDGGNNLQFGGTVANSCGATIPTPGSDPLGSNVLANNGGPTETIALPTGSAAVDAGNDTVCATAPVDGVDQRGVTRPQGPHCDIGAYELIQQQPRTAVPALTEWGMMIFMILAGIGSVYGFCCFCRCCEGTYTFGEGIYCAVSSGKEREDR